MRGGGAPLEPTLMEDAVARVEVKLVGVGGHDLVKIPEAVPTNGGGEAHIYPIHH